MRKKVTLMALFLFACGGSPPGVNGQSDTGRTGVSESGNNSDNSYICVDGDFDDCANRTDDGITWTGSQCCFDESVTCVDGDFDDCANRTDEGIFWTGESCCIHGVKTCTDGDFDSCANRDGMVWTGSQCCLF